MMIMGECFMGLLIVNGIHLFLCFSPLICINSPSCKGDGAALVTQKQSKLGNTNTAKVCRLGL